MILRPIPGYTLTERNGERAHAARIAVGAWFATDEDRPDPSWYPDDADATADMSECLLDLLHLMAQHGLDPHTACEMALTTFDVEATPAPGEIPK